jgi:hypothetical protein
MPIRNVVIHAQAGVGLVRTEKAEKRQASVSFRLTTHRSVSPKFILDEAEAERAYAQELAASLEDPIVLGLIEKGVLEN